MKYSVKEVLSHGFVMGTIRLDDTFKSKTKIKTKEEYSYK